MPRLEVLNCKPIRNRSGFVVKIYQGIPEVLLFNFLLALLLLTIFIFVRTPKNKYSTFDEERLAFLYNQKETNVGVSAFHYNISGGLQPSVRAPRSYFGWIKFVFSLTDEQYLKDCGPDAVHYLSFQKHLIVVVLIVTSICLIVILPINYTMGDNYPTKFLGRTTMSNLPTDSKWLWVHIATVIFYVPLITFTMQDSSGNKAFEMAPLRTVFIKNISKEHRSEDFIRRYLLSLFPKLLIDKIELSYRYEKYLKYHRKYEKVTSVLDYLEKHPNQIKVKPKLCTRKRIDATEYYNEEKIKIEEVLKEELANMRNTATGMAFVTLRNAEEATRLLTAFRGTSHMNWGVSVAPQPDDIVWEYLRLTSVLWYLQWIVVNSGLFAVLCFLITPVVVIDIIIARSKMQRGTASVTTVLVASIFLCIFSYLMPHIVYFSDRILRYHTLSKEQFWTLVKIFFYLFVMVLILPTLGFTSIQAFMATFFEGRKLQWQCIVRPTRSDFYCKYIIAESLLLTSLDLLRLGDLIYYGLCLMVMKSKAELPYVKRQVFSLFSFGKNYAWNIFIFTTAIVHSVFCPLIMPFTLLYFLMKHFVDRHNIYFGFLPSNMVSYEGGKIHTVAINMTTFSVITLKLFMAMIFASVNDLLRAAVCFIGIVIIMIFFPVLMAFRKKPKIQIDAFSRPPVYFPSQLLENGRPIF